MPRADPSTPTSTILRDLLHHAPSETVTFAWLIHALGERSFGIALLLLARPEPIFPHYIVDRSFQTQWLAKILKRIVPSIQYLERFVRPRWRTPFEMTKRVVGGTVLLLGILLFAPIPLSNIPIGLVVILLAVAYIEEDGVLLCIALSVAFVLLLVAAAVIWQIASAAGWL